MTQPNPQPEKGFIITAAEAKGWTPEKIATATYEALFKVAGLIASCGRLVGQAPEMTGTSEADRRTSVDP